MTRCLEHLLLAGQVVRRWGRYRVRGESLVDTGANQQRRSALRAFWTRTALERLASGTKGLHAFNVFSISERDLERLRALQVEYFERMRSLIQQSSPSERVVVYSAQLVALDTGFGS